MSSPSSNTWQYKTGNPAYERYIHSAAWKKLAAQRLEMDKHICPVCGGEATDVHHLTYEHFGNEPMDDLISICRKCHEKAESLYDPSVTPWAMDKVKPEGNNFMAALRVDAVQIAQLVFDYLIAVRGSDFDSLMTLRQPDDAEGKHYWGVLNKAVDALCRKRYSRNCIEDRRIMMLSGITSHLTVIMLAQIEHAVRNIVQGELHLTAEDVYRLVGKWAPVGDALGISKGTTQKLHSDDGTTFGPSLRETVYLYCSIDASFGIRPVPGFSCLSDEDYEWLNQSADRAASVSGEGAFKGEYIPDFTQTQRICAPDLSPLQKKEAVLCAT